MSEGGDESAYDDHVSLEYLCATCRAARVHAHRASDHSSMLRATSAALRRLSGACTRTLHVLLSRQWCRCKRPRSHCICSSVGHAGRWRRPHIHCMCSSVGCARRWRCPRSPCICSSLGYAGRWRCPRSPCMCSSRWSPALPVEAATPAVHALTLALVMRAFLLRLRRPGPLVPPLCLRLLPPPRLPACRFPLAPALSPRGHALVVRGHPQAHGLACTRRGGRGAMLSLAGRWNARERVAWTTRGLVFAARAAAHAGPQTTAGPAVVALYPHSTDHTKEILKSSRDGASNEARASPRAPQRRSESGCDTRP